MAASLLSESAGDEPTASVGVDAGLAIVRPVMSWKGRFNSKILLKLAKSIAQMANCPHLVGGLSRGVGADPKNKPSQVKSSPYSPHKYKYKIAPL